MKNYRRLLAASMIWTMTLLMACAPSAAQVPQKEVFGRIVRVTDGDTVTLLSSDNTQIKLRLAGTDAPESRMPYGQASRVHLAGLVLNKEVVAVTQKQDHYGRNVATLFIGTKDINLSMVQADMAWHYKQFESVLDKSIARKHAQSEQTARFEQQGLWQQPNQQAPWDWRKNRTTISNAHIY
jgi:micrococcal nuclease